MNEYMNAKAESLYRREGKREHEHIQRETVKERDHKHKGNPNQRRERR